MSDFDAVIPSPIAKLGIKTHQDELVGLKMLPHTTQLIKPTSPLSKMVAEQLEAYFDKKLKTFSLPIRCSGTPFQKKVWNALADIRLGHTKTYSSLADELLSGPRAIGNACRANQIVIVLPCHRVVAKQGLGGFSGAISGEWPAIKKWLLQHEQLF